jgi:hypothetical protein
VAVAQSLRDDPLLHEPLVSRVDADYEPLQVGHAEETVHALDRRFFHDDRLDVGAAKNAMTTVLAAVCDSLDFLKFI